MNNYTVNLVCTLVQFKKSFIRNIDEDPDPGGKNRQKSAEILIFFIVIFSKTCAKRIH